MSLAQFFLFSFFFFYYHCRNEFLFLRRNRSRYANHTGQRLRSFVRHSNWLRTTLCSCKLEIKSKKINLVELFQREIPSYGFQIQVSVFLPIMPSPESLIPVHFFPNPRSTATHTFWLPFLRYCESLSFLASVFFLLIATKNRSNCTKNPTDRLTFPCKVPIEEDKKWE